RRFRALQEGGGSRGARRTPRLRPPPRSPGKRRPDPPVCPGVHPWRRSARHRAPHPGEDLVMRRVWVSVLLALPLASVASPAEDDDFPAIPPEVPREWHAFFQSDMPSGQKVAQTIVADLDLDGEEDWIVLSEPTRKGKTWAHVYTPA